MMNDGTVVVCSKDGNLYFLNPKDGKREVVTHLVQVPGSCPNSNTRATRARRINDSPRGGDEGTVYGESAPAQPENSNTISR